MDRMTDFKPSKTPMPLEHTLYSEKVSSSESERKSMERFPKGPLLGHVFILRHEKA